MIDDLDEALRKLLVRELPITNSEVDITFHQPKREWSARLSRPTLNVFLFDIRENVKLRQASPAWITGSTDGGSVQQRRRAFRIELRYTITAWAVEPEDEHRLLARTLLALFRHSELPDDLLPDSLRNQPGPISLEIAQHDALQNPKEFWGAMDNELRPSILCTVAMALDPYQPITTPLVVERELRFIDADTGELESSKPLMFTVKGRVRGLPPGSRAHITLVEQDRTIPIARDGSFVITGMVQGEHDLEIGVAGRAPSHHKLTVPAKEYSLDL